MASHHFQRIVGLLSCHRKAAKAAEIAGSFAAVQSVAVAVAVAVGVEVEAAVVDVVAVAEDVNGIAY